MTSPLSSVVSSWLLMVAMHTSVDAHETLLSWYVVLGAPLPRRAAVTGPGQCRQRGRKAAPPPSTSKYSAQLIELKPVAGGTRGPRPMSCPNPCLARRRGPGALGRRRWRSRRSSPSGMTPIQDPELAQGGRLRLGPGRAARGRRYGGRRDRFVTRLRRPRRSTPRSRRSRRGSRPVTSAGPCRAPSRPVRRRSRWRRSGRAAPACPRRRSKRGRTGT